MTTTNRYMPSLEEVAKLRERGNLCPVYREVAADLETPVSAYLKVAHSPYSFLLESVEGGKNVARYSFIGSDPFMTMTLDRGTAQIVRNGVKREVTYSDPLIVLDEAMKAYRPVTVPGLPRFLGGAVGYLSYETIGYFEKLPRPTRCDYEMPEGIWMLVDTLLAFDHVRRVIQVISHVDLDAPNLESEYAHAVARIDAVIARLRQPLVQPAAATETATVAREAVSNTTVGQYGENVMAAKEYIMAGDIFQVVPSQRFSRPTSADSFMIYRALRMVNPSPYMFYLRMPDGDIVGASPELLVRVQEGEVVTHPIAGTRRRGKDEDEDVALEQELLADEKEQAEHLMLVDLGRNDIGRVSKPGTVKVSRFMFVERYSHVMHIVSHVNGQIRDDMTALDALRACFPAGTVTGAPKIRAMEIIAELEDSRRGIYAGCVGYLGFNGDLDTCISLRTMVVKDGVAYVQAGGGVVADSDPKAEFDESCNKAAALLRAIDVAEQMD